MAKKKVNTSKTYADLIKELRESFFDTPYNLAYRCFQELGFANKDERFFNENASMVVEQMRKACWEAFVPEERKFMCRMFSELIAADEIEGKTPIEAIEWFVMSFSKEIYELSLSNTQSRRSRAGKEFEAIIELILIGAGIPLDSQCNIGKKLFVEKGLCKLVDIVSPGVIEFNINKSDVITISAKTTLRERWQEVPEEMSRTGAKEMFLATLDTDISNDVLSALYEANIRITTTKNIKNQYYSNNTRVLNFEQLIQICNKTTTLWKTFNYDEQLSEKIRTIKMQTKKHKDHDFVSRHYAKLLEELKYNAIKC